MRWLDAIKINRRIYKLFNTGSKYAHTNRSSRFDAKERYKKIFRGIEIGKRHARNNLRGFTEEKLPAISVNMSIPDL
jgi:hypothetical protein